ncbi:hypothetical protein PMAYCL1PPCAC_05728, partial [Pristionchus mayeri]
KNIGVPWETWETDSYRGRNGTPICRWVPDSFLGTRFKAKPITQGTLFYWEYNTSPHRLYVKQNGKEIEAELPGQSIQSAGAHGNSLYIALNDKIYKVDFSSADGFTVSYVRDKHEEETIHPDAICRLDKHIYRMWNDPKEGIVVRAYEEKLTKLVGIHRGKRIYHTIVHVKANPMVTILGGDVIELETFEEDCKVYASDSSQFVYALLWEKEILTVNPEQGEFLPNLHIEGIRVVWQIAGVHNGEITVSGADEDDGWKLATAQLPTEYYENTTSQ